MNIRTTWFALAVALFATFVIVKTAQSIPYNEALIRLQTKDRLVPIDPKMEDEPIGTQLILLNYSQDQRLLLKTWIALQAYPKNTRELLDLYGSETDFQEVVKTYGESAVPVIKYFVENEVFTLTVMTTVSNTLEKAKSVADDILKGAKDLWNRMTGAATKPQAPVRQSPPSSPPPPKLDPTQRGWIGIQFINKEGHQFLGQFVVTKEGVAKWNQTDRLAQGVVQLLTSGVSSWERKRDLNQDIEASDVFFAAVDVIPFVVAAKLLRAGKVVTAGGKELGVAGRTRLLAPRLIPRSPIFLRLGKYSVVAATAYVIVTNPSLINHLLAELAEFFGVPPWLSQGLFWFVLIFIVTFPFRWLLKLAARTILSALSLLHPARTQRIASEPEGNPT